MAELTKEWLKQTIAEYEANRDELPFGLDTNSAIELQAFKLALASLEAEPVAYIFKHPAGKLFWALTDESNKDQSDVIPVYAAPPVPVVPAALPENDDEDGHDIDYLEPSEVYSLGRTAGWNACRDAMLHGAEPVSQTYKLNELSGNSPVTPDDWISCSERMPEKNQNVLISVNFDSDLVEPLICSARYTGSTFRRGVVTVMPGNGIEQATHWMPLPEPPQEVNRG
ncbi:DUF551 domain-containing protein [Escherichia coli]|uniref:DUF551 domain-containing protein n=1 Tax=Escherichia coli TaxID=562 RepID=UPI0021D440A4|nr:DUF551 domain-containing protein [Escherichia coli]MCU6845714.1 DUF551 domain-containing protein [Escherichia coli]